MVARVQAELGADPVDLGAGERRGVAVRAATEQASIETQAPCHATARAPRG